jgi:hypothetical protein
MTVVNTSKYRKIIGYGINFIAPTVFQIYLLTSFINFSIFSSQLGIDAIRYKIAIYCSIGITVFIIPLYFVARVYPKFSLKRKATVFITSLLMLTDGIIWASLGLIEIFMEGIGTISVDFTPLFMGLIIILTLNLFIKGGVLFNIKKEDKTQKNWLIS